MAEYINRKAAISRIKQYCMDAIDGGRYSLDAVDDGIDLVNGIKALPVADVVPVVRCKDCKYFDSDDNWLDKWEYCKKNCIDVSDDWFCKSGMRKDKEDEK